MTHNDLENRITSVANMFKSATDPEAIAEAQNRVALPVQEKLLGSISAPTEGDDSTDYFNAFKETVVAAYMGVGKDIINSVTDKELYRSMFDTLMGSDQRGIQRTQEILDALAQYDVGAAISTVIKAVRERADTPFKQFVKAYEGLSPDGKVGASQRIGKMYGRTSEAIVDIVGYARDTLQRRRLDYQPA